MQGVPQPRPQVLRLVVENFYTWKERLELVFPSSGKVVVVGENGTGKSNLARAVEFLASYFPSSMEWDQHQPWEDTKPAELTLELRVPQKLRSELLRVCALEALRSIRPTLEGDHRVWGERTAVLFEKILKRLDDGGLYKTLILSYLTKPEWRGSLRSFCVSPWDDKYVVLLHYGAFASFPIVEKASQCADLDQRTGYLFEDIGREILTEKERNQYNHGYGPDVWGLDYLSANKKLTAEVKLYRSWLTFNDGDKDEVEGSGDENEEAAVDKAESEDTIHAQKLQEQAEVIHQFEMTVQLLNDCLDRLSEDPQIVVQKVRDILGAGPRQSFLVRQRFGRRPDLKLPFDKVVKQFLRKAVAILREDRGLLLNDECPVTAVTMDSVEDMLFAAKNSLLFQQRASFARVQSVLLRLLNLHMDVVLERTDGEERRSVVFSQKGSERQFGLSKAFGGAYELTLIAATLFLSDAQLVVLDEPGRSLHGPLRKDLCDLIYQQTEKAILIVTHDAEMVSAKRLDDVFYCRKQADDTGSALVGLKALASNEKTRIFMASPDFRETFFAQGAVFVEGTFDKRFLEAISVWFETCAAFPIIPQMPWLNSHVKRIKRAIIVLGSEGNSHKGVKIGRRLGLKWVLVCDFDAIIPKNKKETKEELWKKRGSKGVVKLLREELGGIAGTILDQDVAPDSWLPVLQLCAQHGIFSWEVDMEKAVKVTRPDWDKQNWSTFPFGELVSLVDAMIRRQNPQMLDFVTFLYKNDVFTVDQN